MTSQAGKSSVAVMDPICPVCGENAVVEDQRNRFRTCTACGLVVEETIDEGFLSTNFVDHTQSNAVRQAAGRLLQLQSRIDQDVVTTLAVREYIDECLALAGITVAGQAVDYTVSMFHTASQGHRLRADGRRGLIAACFKQAMHELNRSYDVPTIAFVFDIPSTSVTRGSELLATRGIAPGISQESVEFLARSMAHRMQLDAATVTRVSDLANVVTPLMRTKELMASRPRSIAAACVWSVLEDVGLKHRWAELELASAVTRTTFSTLARRIRDLQTRTC